MSPLEWTEITKAVAVRGEPRVHNHAVGGGTVVQAGTITGGVHVHSAPPQRPVPRQLPPAPRPFVGRMAELSRLDRAVIDKAGTVAISAIGGLGYIAHHTGDDAQALRHHRQALAIYRDLGNAYLEATSLDRLAEAHHGLGDDDEARAAWGQALDLHRTHHRLDEADKVERHLADLDDVS